MLLKTSVTIDGRTDHFESSPQTLGSNIYVTLLCRDFSDKTRAACKRIEEQLQSSDIRSFRFNDEDSGISVTADDVAESDQILSLNAA